MRENLKSSNSWTSDCLGDPREDIEKLQSLIRDIQSRHTVMICEMDDNDAVSIPLNVEYSEEDNAIIVNCRYPRQEGNYK